MYAWWRPPIADLREEVAAGRFREDLYYRLNVFPITLLPLRARRDDILPLAMRLLASHVRAGERIPALHPAAAQLLLTHAWTGNVRELENVMQRALVMCDGDIVRDIHIVFDAAPTVVAAAAPVLREPVERAAKPLAAVEPDYSDQALAQSLALAEQKIILQALRSIMTRVSASRNALASVRARCATRLPVCVRQASIATTSLM
jgi:two-component system response regulator FlrC